MPSRPRNLRNAEQGTSSWTVSEDAFTDEDARLLASLNAARAGNVVAFEAIYRALAPRLSRYAHGLVGQDGDDIAAEAWLQIVRDLDRFDGDWDAFRGWAARILRNRAIDHLRAQARRPSRTSTVDALIDRAGPDDTAVAAEESISTAAAVELIASLPPDQAEAVLLRTVVGLDAKGAAAVLGKRAGAVRVAAHRGLKTLATQLEGTGRSNGRHRRGAGEMT
ncbi:MAG TPA: RNA polymerase sigma factor [Jatrophihabitans sp.]|jgi:RNA polymerase sigma-70 factor (ECF subfamily)|nr:RNA polymerase sigma factor [Jatrophihabitans sp.]